MPSVPLKPQYGPTLGRLLAPRWHAARRLNRNAIVIAGVALLAGAVGGVLTLLDSRFSHSGRISFSFSYRGLYRTSPDPGGYVKVARRSHGLLQSSYAVNPLTLPPYSGSVTGEMPLVASGYAASLARRFAGFRMEGEGKTRISATLSGYDVLYSAIIDGHKLYGRDVLLLPERPDARQGVAIQMLSAEPASVSKPVASSGVLETPLKTFSFS